ncbi:hypothetical protein HPP92_025029 [Vanilla planifolia]|uniref:Uncharacterized protein n=1 Tax=Vanilla planifolia TaxID=51239 RepID=A0A835PH40_VANPL|nr:hypothetical protein HPP92_025029 [Vanilla planifolia]
MASVAVAASASAAAVLPFRNSLQVSSRSQYTPIILLPKVAIALHDSHRSLAVPFGGAAFPRRLLRRQRPSSFSFICSSGSISPFFRISSTFFG